MTVKPLEVERSALRVWAWALLGVPFVLLGVDVLGEGRFVNLFGTLVYGSESMPPFEPRDRLFALATLVAGLILVIWGLRELLLPRKVIVADEEGMKLAVAGPLRRGIRVPWDEIESVEATSLDEDGEVVHALLIGLAKPSRLPADPWGARWADRRTLLIEAIGWAHPAQSVATEITKRRPAPVTDPTQMPWE